MFEVKGYLANDEMNASSLNGDVFSVQHDNAREFLNWLKNKTVNSVIVVLVSIEELN